MFQQAFLKQLKRMQDCLGAFNDLEIQQEAMEGFARRMATGGGAEVPTFLAMGRLLSRLADRQAEERRKFSKRFAAFSEPGNRERMRRLVAQGGPG